MAEQHTHNMKRIKIADAPPRVIDWLVAKVEGVKPVWLNDLPVFKKTIRYSTDPAQGQPILEREKITLMPIKGDLWDAWRNEGGQDDAFEQSGPTMLIAGLRCFLVSRLGDEAEVPEELLAGGSHG